MNNINNTNIGNSALTETEVSIYLYNSNPSVPNFDMLIHFISVDSLINTYISCNRTDNFSFIEEKLYQIFPELRYKKLYFLHKNKYIKRSSTIKKNKISNGDQIIIYEIQ